jgi:hypothetical protein
MAFHQRSWVTDHPTGGRRLSCSAARPYHSASFRDFVLSGLIGLGQQACFFIRSLLIVDRLFVGASIVAPLYARDIGKLSGARSTQASRRSARTGELAV